MAFPFKSLENTLKAAFIFAVLVPIFCVVILLMMHQSSWWMAALVGLSLIVGLFFRATYQRVFSAFDRASIQLEALQQEDYSLNAKPPFILGKVSEFHSQLNALGEILQTHKSHYDQQQFLVYRLIDQLNTPILVFNHRVQLSYANAAFANLFGKPWQAMRQASPSYLGLETTPEWHFTDAVKSNQWQIRTSEFLDQGESYQLLVFINIQAALRESQLEAWQKLIRVLSHEIRNSLTPVAALTQNLQEKAASEREREALNLISERCQHLQDFVSRYASLHKPLSVNCQSVVAAELWQRLAGLFPEIDLQFSSDLETLWVDPVLLHQVLINLIKNAIEAGSPNGTVNLCIQQKQNQLLISVVDQGRGLSNIENLFVPFYSTKPQGQGIGLSLSQHIIEQMGGSLRLFNNSTSIGACAEICLPLARRYR